MRDVASTLLPDGKHVALQFVASGSVPVPEGSRTSRGCKRSMLAPRAQPFPGWSLESGFCGLMPNRGFAVSLCPWPALQDGQGSKAEQDRPMVPAMGRSVSTGRAAGFSAGMTLLSQPYNLGTSPSWFPLLQLCSLGGSGM